MSRCVQDSETSVDQIAYALDRLAPRERAVASLRLHGLSVNEVSERLGIKPSSVRTTMFRVYQKYEVSDFDSFRRTARIPDAGDPRSIQGQVEANGTAIASHGQTDAHWAVLDESMRILFSCASLVSLALLLFCPYGSWRYDLVDQQLLVAALIGYVVGVALTLLWSSRSIPGFPVRMAAARIVSVIVGGMCTVLSLVYLGVLDRLGIILSPLALRGIRYAISFFITCCVFITYGIRSTSQSRHGSKDVPCFSLIVGSLIVLLTSSSSSPVGFYLAVALTGVSSVWQVLGIKMGKRHEVDRTATPCIRELIKSCILCTANINELSSLVWLFVFSVSTLVPFCIVPGPVQITLPFQIALGAVVALFGIKTCRSLGFLCFLKVFATTSFFLVVGFATGYFQAGLLVATLLLSIFSFAAVGTEPYVFNMFFQKNSVALTIVIGLCFGSTCGTMMEWGYARISVAPWGLPYPHDALAAVGIALMLAVTILGIVAVAQCFVSVDMAVSGAELIDLLGQPDTHQRLHAYLTFKGLNDTQISVAIQTLHGQSIQQIADTLHYSTSSVKLARRVAYQCLNVHSVQGLRSALLQVVGM